MKPSDLGFVDQILEDPGLLDKLHREYRQEIPELGLLLKIEDPQERKDQVRDRIGGRDPSWYWKVVNSRYPSLPISGQGSFDDFSFPFFPPPDDDTGPGLLSDWRKLLEPVYEELRQKVFPAVGSLERTGNNEHMGTGWLVGEQMVITNRHVLTKKKMAARNSNDEIIYEEGSIRFDLRNGPKEDEQKEFTVTEVLYLARDEEPDVALLRVKNRSSGEDLLPIPLTLCPEEPISGQMVLAVGYPGPKLDDICKDNRGKVEQIFPGSVFADGQLNPKKFNIKRMSVGYLDEVTGSRLYHFCNTTGGSSGSAIINLEGQVVGLHYDGDCDQQRNFAVPAAVIRQIVEESLPKS